MEKLFLSQSITELLMATLAVSESAQNDLLTFTKSLLLSGHAKGKKYFILIWPSSVMHHANNMVISQVSA